MPPLAISVALPAVVVSKNCVPPPNAPPTGPPLAIKVALPAVEVSPNAVEPPNAPLTVPPLLVKVPLVAVEVSQEFRGAGECAGDCAALGKKVAIAPARRAVSEKYDSSAATGITSSHKGLCDP